MLKNILEKEILTKEDAMILLNLENYSEESYRLLHAANKFSRKQFQSKGKVFAQIGIDSQKCDINCVFCSLGADNYGDKVDLIKNVDEIIEEVKRVVSDKVDEVFLMTTANFNKSVFLDYVQSVKNILPPSVNLVVNTDDFDLDYAKKLKEYGVYGAYHIVRLQEGLDTKVSKNVRVNTLDAIKVSGLKLYYCVEPIGPEHKNEEIIEEIFRARDYPVEVMAAMKRIAVAGTVTYHRGEISSATLAKIVATTTLCVKPKRAMGVHEPDDLSLISGANQIYAEYGSNPRDINYATEECRGLSVKEAQYKLKSLDWK